MSARVHVTREELEAKIQAGEIDTVLMAFPDLQGRLVGKRTTGRFFLETVADGGTENCDYLIACDMDNNPVPGYRFTSYEAVASKIRADKPISSRARAPFTQARHAVAR